MTEPTPDATGEVEDIRRMVAAYVAAGADESVQRVITAVNRLSRRLTRWYDRQLAALGINSGEWIVLEQLAGNAAVVEALREAGFADVSVTGAGAMRYAEATWPREDTSAPLPAQVVAVSEIEDA